MRPLPCRPYGHPAGARSGPDGQKIGDAIVTRIPGARIDVPDATHVVLSRPDLTGRLAVLDATSVVAVVAPAGYGKTVLLADWGGRTAVPTAWVDVDDDPPGRFWATVAAAVSRLPAAANPAPTACAAWVARGLADDDDLEFVDDLLAAAESGGAGPAGAGRHGEPPHGLPAGPVRAGPGATGRHPGGARRPHRPGPAVGAVAARGSALRAAPRRPAAVGRGARSAGRRDRPAPAPGTRRGAVRAHGRMGRRGAAGPAAAGRARRSGA